MEYEHPTHRIDTPYVARTKSFTRRSRVLPESLQRTVDTHGDKYIIPALRSNGMTTVDENMRIDQQATFGRQAQLIIEIGPGIGDQVVAAAQRWPDIDFLLFEVWAPGIAKLVSRAVREKVSNIRVIEADAAQALPILLPDACAQEVWTFFPDPWRKARHHKRRLVSDAFAQTVSRVLVDGGVWRLATDWDDYAWQMRDVIEDSVDLVNPFEGENPDPHDPDEDRGGYASRWDGRVLTRFEQRGRLAERNVHDLVAIRVPRLDP